MEGKASFGHLLSLFQSERFGGTSSGGRFNHANNNQRQHARSDSYDRRESIGHDPEQTPVEAARALVIAQCVLYTFSPLRSFSLFIPSLSFFVHDSLFPECKTQVPQGNDGRASLQLSDSVPFCVWRN